MSNSITSFSFEVSSRLDAITEWALAGGAAQAAAAMAEALSNGGVIQAFGTGHSEAFAMEIAGRAGGLIPTSKIALRDLVLHGDRDVSELDSLEGSVLERDTGAAEELFELSLIDPRDIFLIASNSGVNGSIVGLALEAKERGHTVIAVTSLEHTSAVETKHPSGMRLSEIADIVIDNQAPYGDTTLEVSGGGGVGAVSSITAAYIAQLLTIETVQCLVRAGKQPPIYISANIPGGDEHNTALVGQYVGRLRREA
ncbi:MULTISPECIES: sugar isomerase domain-containing protein [Arthrobacter]|uniref:Sugar isomerase n=1 Tax=Arthrobacter psychrochitiniphilus TaxID=291045 RepID=A0A2V3E145_9MICC|nr:MULTISPECIES: SIS domain-containing protein [Arthrobacter]NYG15498.1 putative phosphosugar-binding protein [Arthrobacter psychrochitiniphilus]PXA66993.1 sugar isomerase [Arthrobacter psychrochitiniphilus]